MFISRRTSGGRGEYEISHPAPGEVHPRELVGRVICLDLGIGAPVNTGVVLLEQGGKLRLRLAGASIQIHRQAAAVLMMPEPVRADAALGVGAPVLQRNRYAIERLVADSVLLLPPNMALMRINSIVVTNRTYNADEISLQSRAAQLTAIWQRREEFPAEIAELLGRHADAVGRGSMIGSDVEQVVVAIQRAVSDSSVDLGIIYSEATDVLPALDVALRREVLAAPPLDIAEVDVEDLAIKRRTLKEWRRWVNARGPASAKFRQRVRDAYQATCIVCGAHFPPTPHSPGPGVDSAHILPWSEYGLDDISNGLCLCKIHHWAFDESILRMRFEDGNYLVEIPEHTCHAITGFDPSFSIERLMEHVGSIPTSRLPRSQADWPRPQFLSVLDGFAD